MRLCRPALLIAVSSLLVLGLPIVANCFLQAAPQARPQNTPLMRAVGRVKSIQAGSITLSPDSGGELAVTTTESTRFLRVAPGETDLKNAAPVEFQDIQPGDRVLVRGQGSSDGHSMTALSVIVMKQADLSAKQERERKDWQRRGVGGLVSAVDPAQGTVSITSGGFGANRQIAVRTSRSTIVRRYAPDSVRFDDAKPAPLDQVQSGDQLWARGALNPDGTELSAEEMVFGTFRNIAGTIRNIDAADNSLTVQDVIGKAEVTVTISPDSQVKKLPPEMAQRIAMRLKATAAGAVEQSRDPQTREPLAGGGASNRTPQAPEGAANGPGGHGTGPPDLQRFLNRIPGSTLADLQKGDAVMIVSTMGGASASIKAIILLAGVEPILTANPGRNGSMMLSPWSLSGPAGEAEGTP